MTTRLRGAAYLGLVLYALVVSYHERGAAQSTMSDMERRMDRMEQVNADVRLARIETTLEGLRVQQDRSFTLTSTLVAGIALLLMETGIRLIGRRRA